MSTTFGARTPLVTAGAGVPLHRQLFLVLHDEIARGALAPGDALPTEQSLCDQFGVSRITVRRALADLADAGLIERRHGVGSFVTRPATVAPESVGGGSYMDELRQIRVRDRGRRHRVRRPTAADGRRPARLGRGPCAARAAAAPRAAHRRAVDDHRGVAAHRARRRGHRSGAGASTALPAAGRGRRRAGPRATTR